MRDELFHLCNSVMGFALHVLFYHGGQVPHPRQIMPLGINGGVAWRTCSFLERRQSGKHSIAVVGRVHGAIN